MSVESRLISRIVNRLAKVLVAVAVVSIVFMSLATTADALSRNAGFGSLAFVHDLSVLALLCSAFLSLAHVERKSAHVNFSMVVDRMPITLKRWIVGTLYSLVTACVGWAGYVSAQAAWEAFASNERMLGIAQFVTWPGRAAVALGFLALFLVMLDRCIDIFGGHSDTRLDH